VGATPKLATQTFENIVENGLLAFMEKLTVSGLEDKGGIWENWVMADGLNLPFDDKSFDLVISNAVIEHVGNEDDQAKFVLEHIRVGRFWVFTTPNRLFPVESHTYVVLSHMRKTWKHPWVSRLLSKRDINRITPPDTRIKGGMFSPTFIVHNN
jgi:ubiquinone/menaquinone biosynthesis C-methylase UbiE